MLKCSCYELLIVSNVRRDGASIMKVVRPVESAVETQPKLQPALLILSAMISQYFIRLLLAIGGFADPERLLLVVVENGYNR